MRAGLNAIQQTLTPEASIIVNQSLAEAASRRHGQTTPLHVAATLLASPCGLFRHACALSQPISSHPLQCRALELCFSVALDRLPTSSSPFSSRWRPSISNALMAALKRAQAHQRRGCNEHQQLIAMKVELEQLIISILDDPSVSRVMREASFSSPAVKTVIQQCFPARPFFSLIQGGVHPSSYFDGSEGPVRTDLVLGLPSKGQSQGDDFFRRLFNGLCEKVTWQKEAAAVIASAVVRCRDCGSKRSDSRLLFLGEDTLGKKKMAEALAEIVFSADPVIISPGDGGAIDRLVQVLRRRPCSVIVLDNVTVMDILFLQKLMQAMERGFFMDSHGQEIHLGGTVFIFISKEEKIFKGERAASKRQCLDLNLAACSDEEAIEDSPRSSDLTDEQTDCGTPSVIRQLQSGDRFVSELVRVVDAAVVFKPGRDVSGDCYLTRRRNGGAAD